MKKILLFAGALAFLGLGIMKISAQKNEVPRPSRIKEKKTVYFNPEVYPNIEEIKEPTNMAFFSAVSDNMSNFKSARMLRADVPVQFDSVDTKAIVEYCKNNEADFAVVPKVKYFKVGLGKYVFSNQVVVSMKLYDSQGNLLTETNYDTYRKNMRLLGSAENSIRIGTTGAMKHIFKNMRKKRGTESVAYRDSLN